LYWKLPTRLETKSVRWGVISLAAAVEYAVEVDTGHYFLCSVVNANAAG
jgi:hypothetical protein